MENLAYRENYKEELINGKTVLMSPSPSVNHNIVAGNIYNIFSNYLQDKKCMVFQDGLDLYLSEKDIFVPDMMVVCNLGIIKKNGIYGAPNLVVEILSPGTSKRDKGYKKETYEKHGVQEYWIVNTEDFSIEIYILKDGRYELDDIYYYDKNLSEEEKEDIKTVFTCNLFEDLIINTDDIFDKVIKY